MPGFQICLELLNNLFLKLNMFHNIPKMLSVSPIKKIASELPKKVLNFKYSTKSEFTFELKPCKLHKLDKGPATCSTLTSQEALKLYEELVTLRRLENAASELYKGKFIRGFCHLYAGQEAVAVGIRPFIRSTDSVITAYRCHGWNYEMGVSALAILSELTGRSTGCSRGKGGSMHMYGPKFYGGNGIVGAHVPIGAGLALAHKYLNDGGVSFTLYGDGAANQGQVFEAFNMAKLWNLPCVFICENNRYGLGTSAQRAAASTDYYTRGDYIPGVWVDGMDTIAVREAARFVVDYVTSGKGPIVLEVETYRYFGHSMSDPGTSYRSREEVQEIRQTRDAVASFKEKIIAAELVTADQLKAIDSEVKKVISNAVKHAKEDPEIAVEELTADIYKICVEPDNVIRGIHPQAPAKHFSVHK